MIVEGKKAKLYTYLIEKFSNEGTGHDWHHILRVTNNALLISDTEGGDKTVIELAALLHDIDDHKFNGGDVEAGARTAKKVMIELGFDEELIEKVTSIINKVSYKGANVDSVPNSIEGQIVQDADRLDAIGAIGIARAFAYGGSKNRPIYEPNVAHELHDSFDQYMNAKSHTINHFYEKLLLLKGKMNTKTGKKMAEKRHQVMVDFLDQFYDEWKVS